MEGEMTGAIGGGTTQGITVAIGGEGGTILPHQVAVQVALLLLPPLRNRIPRPPRHLLQIDHL